MNGTSPMPPVHRHQLAYPSAEGWRELLEAPGDAEAQACLCHWAQQALPLVVGTQPPAERGADVPARLALGLAAPLQWQRRRLALRLAPSRIAWFGEFPALAQVLAELPRAARPALQRLDSALRALGVQARVHGSAGWQQLTGLAYLHAHSDLDCRLPVDGPAQADAVAALLDGCDAPLRLDGELSFAGGAAVAWREWAAWRAGRCRGVLVRRLHGAAVEHDVAGWAAGWPRAA